MGSRLRKERVQLRLGASGVGHPRRVHRLGPRGARSWPEEFMRSTYHIVGSDQLRQPGAMHWLYNDGTAVHVDDWTLPESEAEGLHNGVTVTPLFVRRGETDRTVTAGHIGARVHNDWSWANVALADPDDPWIVDGEIWLEHDVAAPWMVYRTSCVEEGFPTLFADKHRPIRGHREHSRVRSRSVRRSRMGLARGAGHRPMDHR